MMVFMVGMLAFAIDLGYICTVDAQLDRAVDAAAIAGAGALIEGTAAAQDRAVEYLVRNPVGGTIMMQDESQLEALKAEFLARYGEDLDVTWGHWDSDTRTMEVSDQLPSALTVSLTYSNMPLFFGKMLGTDSYNVTSQATAIYQPRDIMLVLDFSASMNDDSELTAISTVGQETVEASLYQMWLDLDSPTYGNMSFTPEWVTIPGNSLSFDVTWKLTEVDVSAAQNMQQVRLYFDNGSTQSFNISSKSGTWKGTGSKSGRRIDKVRVKIGGQYETVDFYNNSHVRRGLELDGVDYPSQGDWDDYIEYARSSSSSMPWYDSAVYSAGYRGKFGFLTLVNHWNKNKPAYDQTPILWKVSAQPVTAVKNAVDVFMDYIRLVDVDDRVGLSVYNSSSGMGELESELTLDLDFVSDAARHRQAGHYHDYTNIAAGMQKAREEFEANGRVGARKMMVLMTDGNANWTPYGYNTNAARNNVYDEAELCAELKIPIVTISLGAGADVALMEDVAEITDGLHFNIPGGCTVDEYSEELMEVFRRIASARPLLLVN
ncbi:MAG: VWA domain-containing protein [Planctomycetales bacterium]|nr:VWA domain-containing protein [Planctomycetales bacterium]